MAWQAVLDTVLPVFALVLVGFIFGRRHPADLPTVTGIVVYLSGPALVFSSLVEGPLAAREAVTLALGTCTIVVGVGVLMWLLSRLLGARPGALYLPAMFMNCGNMLLPLALFAFGDAGLRHGVVIFVTAVVLQTSLGVMIASGKLSPVEMFRLPYIYAAGLALTLRAAGIEAPTVMVRPVALLGQMAVPLMLIALGLRLRNVKTGSWSGTGYVVALRFIGGYAIGYCFVSLTGLEGAARGCLLLASVMPSAVINFIFAENYGGEPGDVATAVVASTLLSVITTPLVLAFGL